VNTPTGVLADKYCSARGHIPPDGGYGIKGLRTRDKLAGGFLFDGQRAVRTFVNHIVQIGAASSSTQARGKRLTMVSVVCLGHYSGCGYVVGQRQDRKRGCLRNDERSCWYSSEVYEGCPRFIICARGSFQVDIISQWPEHEYQTTRRQQVLRPICCRRQKDRYLVAPARIAV